MSIEFDGQRVFEGEIRKAPGVTGSVEECSEVILFTTDVSLLRAIESQDRVVRVGLGGHWCTCVRVLMMSW